MNNLFDVLLSPLESIKASFINWLKNLGLAFISQSYLICLGMACICLLLYIAGDRKAGKYVTISIIIYALLQVFKLFLI